MTKKFLCVYYGFLGYIWGIYDVTEGVALGGIGIFLAW